jgi:hypothetical protein
MEFKMILLVKVIHQTFWKHVMAIKAFVIHINELMQAFCKARNKHQCFMKNEDSADAVMHQEIERKLI